MKVIKRPFFLLCACLLSSSDICAKRQDNTDYQLVKQQKKDLLANERKVNFLIIGTPFPKQILATTNKENQVIQAFHGRVVLLHFWATWCPPCREELESIQQLQSSFDKDQFVVAAISHDVSKLDIKDFLKNKKINMSIYFDSRTKMINQLYPENGGQLPISILVDKEGRMVDLMIGVQQWSSQVMINKIKNLVIEQESIDEKN